MRLVVVVVTLEAVLVRQADRTDLLVEEVVLHLTSLRPQRSSAVLKLRRQPKQ